MPSTNALLREQAQLGGAPWSVLLAAEQTAGRGRHGRPWHSPPGNLYLSVLMPAPRSPQLVTLLPLMGGVAVVESLARFGVAARVKWPNDVLTPDERKLAGVLAEGVGGSAGIESVVLGIGVNLIADRAAWPAALRDVAAAARDPEGRAPGRHALAARVLATLRERAARLDAGGAPELLSSWRAHSVDWWGRAVEVESGGERVTGVARELGPDGSLVLELSGGERRHVVSGEARRVRAADSGGG